MGSGIETNSTARELIRPLTRYRFRYNSTVAALLSLGNIETSATLKPSAIALYWNHLTVATLFSCAMVQKPPHDLDLELPHKYGARLFSTMVRPRQHVFFPGSSMRYPPQQSLLFGGEHGLGGPYGRMIHCLLSARSYNTLFVLDFFCLISNMVKNRFSWVTFQVAVSKNTKYKMHNTKDKNLRKYLKSKLTNGKTLNY